MSVNYPQFSFDLVSGQVHSSSASLSSAFTITIASNVNKLLLQAITQAIRFTLDGTTPTATIGFELKADGTILEIPVVAGQTVKVIEETASAVIQYQQGA